MKRKLQGDDRKELDRLIRGRMQASDTMPKQTLLDFVRERSNYDEETIEKLISADINRTVNYSIRKVRDANGKRILFNAKNSKLVVNTEICDNQQLLYEITSPMYKSYTGAGRNLNTIASRQREIGGQMTFLPELSESFDAICTAQ